MHLQVGLLTAIKSNSLFREKLDNVIRFFAFSTCKNTKGSRLRGDEKTPDSKSINDVTD